MRHFERIWWQQHKRVPELLEVVNEDETYLRGYRVNCEGSRLDDSRHSVPKRSIRYRQPLQMDLLGELN